MTASGNWPRPTGREFHRKYRIYKDMGDDIGMIGGCQIWGVALPGDFYCAHGARMDKEDEHEAG